MSRERGHRVLTQVEIEDMIVSDVELMEEATEVYGDLLEDEAKKENAYKRAYNSAYFTYGEKGGHDIRRTYAEHEASTEREEYRIAQAEVAAQKEVLWTIRNRIDAIRSLNANVRSQV